MAGPTIDELMEFSRRFRAELYAEGLVQGNFSSAVGRTQTRGLINNRTHFFFLHCSDFYLITCRLSCLFLLIKRYCVLSTGVKAVPGVCHRVSQLFTLNPFKTITQSEGVICIGFSCSVRNSPLTFSSFFFFFFLTPQTSQTFFSTFLHHLLTSLLIFPPLYFFPSSAGFAPQWQKAAVLQAASRGAGDVQSGGAPCEAAHL